MCDIMCTTNTKSVYIEKISKKKSKKLEGIRASFPYKKPENLINPLKLADPTPMQRLRQSQFQQVLNAELHAEREEFLNKLLSERRYKLQVENRCATMIQAIFRGFRRRKLQIRGSLGSRKKFKVSLTAERINAELCTWASSLGLKPITGLSLVSKDRLLKRKAKFQFAAAIKLQCFFRMIVCMKKYKRKQKLERTRKIITSQMTILRFFKWVHRITKEERDNNLHRRKAATTLQTCYRTWASRTWVRLLKNARRDAARASDAAIRIQRTLARKKQNKLLELGKQMEQEMFDDL